MTDFSQTFIIIIFFVQERAIMPRPSTTDSLDTSHDLQQRLNIITTNTGSSTSTTTTNVPLIINNHTSTDDLTNSNSSIFSSPDYRQQSTLTRLSLPTTLSNKKPPNIQLVSIQQQQQQNDLNLSSSNSRPIMEDKCIQCIDDNVNSTTEEQITKNNNSSMKRNGQSSDESWTVAADT
jgi:hypothetical protein